MGAEIAICEELLSRSKFVLEFHSLGECLLAGHIWHSQPTVWDIRADHKWQDPLGSGTRISGFMVLSSHELALWQPDTGHRIAING